MSGVGVGTAVRGVRSGSVSNAPGCTVGVDLTTAAVLGMENVPNGLVARSSVVMTATGGAYVVWLLIKTPVREAIADVSA